MATERGHKSTGANAGQRARGKRVEQGDEREELFASDFTLLRFRALEVTSPS